MIDIASELLRAHSILGHIKNGAPRAISNALNRTIDGVKTDIVREVTSRYDIKPGKVREAIKVNKSFSTTLRASVSSSGSPIPLIQFNVSPSRPGKQKTGVQLRASVKRSGGRPIPGAFVANIGGKLQVAVRTGKPRTPTKQLFGPAVPVMMGEVNIHALIMENAESRFAKRIEHEIAFLLSKGK